MSTYRTERENLVRCAASPVTLLLSNQAVVISNEQKPRRHDGASLTRYDAHASRLVDPTLLTDVGTAVSRSHLELSSGRTCFLMLSNRLLASTTSVEVMGMHS